MIVNINYKGLLASGELDKVHFPKKRSPPVQQRVATTIGSCMLVFPSGKFRLMGVKRPLSGLDFLELPLYPASIELQSATVTDNYRSYVSLSRLANRLTSQRCSYEPELFPAARLLQFRPMCVNVFASGTIVILGVKHLHKLSELIANVHSIILSAVN